MLLKKLHTSIRIETLRNPETPRAHTHALWLYSPCKTPKPSTPIYIFIFIYRGLRRVFRFCGVFSRVLQIIHCLLPIHKLAKADLKLAKADLQTVKRQYYAENTR